MSTMSAPVTSGSDHDLRPVAADRPLVTGPAETCRSFVAAAWNKYHIEMSTDDELGILMPKKGPAQVTQSGHLLLPWVVHLPRCGISKAVNKENGETEDDLKSMAFGVTELDLSDNSLSSLVEVIKIIRCMPKITFLDLTRNPLRASSVSLVVLPFTENREENATGNAYHYAMRFSFSSQHSRKSVSFEEMPAIKIEPKPPDLELITEVHSSTSGDNVEITALRDAASMTECMCTGKEDNSDDCDCCDDYDYVEDDEEDTLRKITPNVFDPVRSTNNCYENRQSKMSSKEEGDVKVQDEKNVKCQRCNTTPAESLPQPEQNRQEQKDFKPHPDDRQKEPAQMKEDTQKDPKMHSDEIPSNKTAPFVDIKENVQPAPSASTEPLEDTSCDPSPIAKTEKNKRKFVNESGERTEQLDKHEVSPTAASAAQEIVGTIVDLAVNIAEGEDDDMGYTFINRTSGCCSSVGSNRQCQCMRYDKKKCCPEEKKPEVPTGPSSVIDTLVDSLLSSALQEEEKVVTKVSTKGSGAPCGCGHKHPSVPGTCKHSGNESLSPKVNKASPLAQPVSRGVESANNPQTDTTDNKGNKTAPSADPSDVPTSSESQKNHTDSSSKDAQGQPGKSPDSLQFPYMRHLILNATGLRWDGVIGLLSIFPELEELHLSLNDYTSVDLPEDLYYPALQRLFFNNNPVEVWAEWSKLGLVFHGLKQLFLADCQINGIGDVDSLQKAFPVLEVLSLNRTKLTSWDDIDKLRLFPCLKDIRLAGIPFLDSQDPDERRQQLLARLPNSTQLNGSLVDEEERVNAERAFVRKFIYSDDKPSRYFELEYLHGRLEPLADISLAPQTKFNVQITMEQRSTLIVVDATHTVLELKKSLEAWSGLTHDTFVLFYRDRQGEPPTPPVKLKFLDKKLTAYGLQDGDEFIIEQKPRSY